MGFSTVTNERRPFFRGVLFFLVSALLSVGSLQPTAAQINDEQKISETEGAPKSFSLENGANFGVAAARLANLDSDDDQEVAVGAFRTDDGGTNRGAIWILDLGSDGTAADVQKISSTAGTFGGTLSNRDRFGGAVAFLGDLDGDGKPSLAVGADAGLEGGDPGTVWILELNSDGTVASEQKITDGAGGFGGSLGGNDKFGSGVADLGDIDGDGKTNLAVGARYDNRQKGAVWILDLNDNGTVADEQKIDDSAGGFEGSLDSGDKLGNGLAFLGNLNEKAPPRLPLLPTGTATAPYGSCPSTETGPSPANRKSAPIPAALAAIGSAQRPVSRRT